jgi:hypothetical protein
VGAVEMPVVLYAITAYKGVAIVVANVKVRMSSEDKSFLLKLLVYLFIAAINE